MAAGFLANKSKLELSTAIDERSAAFLALGYATATGTASAVITTSGTAVANLLPAAVEADRSFQPLLFLTADRPLRLKNCGSNQTVNQEEFLRPVCRYFQQTPAEGIHLISQKHLISLMNNLWEQAHLKRGPIHLNIPLEEPLHSSKSEQEEIFSEWPFKGTTNLVHLNCRSPKSNLVLKSDIPTLDLSCPGVVIAGPWRGNSSEINIFQDSLKEFQSIAKWPVFADPLSGVPNDLFGLIGNWELLIGSELDLLENKIQFLRLGPLPASKKLEKYLLSAGSEQVLITEGDDRNLDPLGNSMQWSGGLVSWWNLLSSSYLRKPSLVDSKPSSFLSNLIMLDQIVEDFIDEKLPMQTQLNEPSLARWLPRLLPPGVPIMLSASSPIRDWISFGGKAALNRRCFGFRGASGIDGTLSLAMGLSMALGPAILITGDLALLHDSNGWMHARSKKAPLVILLIDNLGGGIFQQLNIQTDSKETLEKLFLMPQLVDPLILAKAHNVTYKEISNFDELSLAIEWALSLSEPVLLRVSTDSAFDSLLRRETSESLKNFLSNSQSQ